MPVISALGRCKRIRSSGSFSSTKQVWGQLELQNLSQNAKEKLGRKKGLKERCWGGWRMMDRWSQRKVRWYDLNSMPLLYVEGNVWMTFVFTWAPQGRSLLFSCCLGKASFLSVEMRHHTLNMCATCICGCTNTCLSPYCSSGLFAEFWKVPAIRSWELPWKGLSHILRNQNTFPCSLNCEVELLTLWISNRMWWAEKNNCW